jgi:hypothetical protein
VTPHSEQIPFDTAAMVLVGLLRDRSRFQNAQEFGKAANYRSSFLRPKRKLRLIEEVFFLYSALIQDAIASTQADRTTRVLLKTEFQFRVQQELAPLFAQADASYASRRATHVKEYTSLLASGGDEIGLSTTFAKQLHGSLAAGLGCAVDLLPLILAARRFTHEVASSMCVEPPPDSDDEEE